MFTQSSEFSQQHQQASLQEILDAKRPNLLGTSKYQVVAEVVNLIEENESLVSYNCTIVCCTKQNHKRNCFVALTCVTRNVHE
jgi:hypothetical protein